MKASERLAISAFLWCISATAFTSPIVSPVNCTKTHIKVKRKNKKQKIENLEGERNYLCGGVCNWTVKQWWVLQEGWWTLSPIIPLKLAIHISRASRAGHIYKYAKKENSYHTRSQLRKNTRCKMFRVCRSEYWIIQQSKK